MALSDIIRRIDSDARDEAERIVSTAEAEGEATRTHARSQVRLAREEVLARTKIAAEDDARTRIATAKLRGRDSMLAEKHELIDRVLLRAISGVVALDDDAYAALLARHVGGLARGGESVSVAAADAERLAGRLEAALGGVAKGVSVDAWDAPIERGVLLEGPRMRVEISPEALVEARREELEELVAGVLFDESEGEG